MNDKGKGEESLKHIGGIVKSQLNVKNISFRFSHANTKDVDVELDTKQTPELEAEGYAREMSRLVQEFRKTLGLQKKDNIELTIITDSGFKEVLEKQKQFIKDRTNSKKLEIFTTPKTNSPASSQVKERFKNKIEFKIKDKGGEIAIIVTKG